MGRRKINSKQKGKTGELEACRDIENALCLPSHTLHRSAQFCGKDGQSADIRGIEGIHFEIKRTERIQIYDAMEQAVSDCKPENVPTVVFRRNHSPWMVTIQLSDLKKFAQAIASIPGKEKTAPKRRRLIDPV